MEKYKNILFSTEARKNVKTGLKVATDLIIPTLGARGRKIIIDKEFAKPDVIDDGKIILDEIELKDTKRQLGVKLLQDACNQTNERVGDGTTTTAIITNALVQEIIHDEEENLNLMGDDTDVLKIKKEIKEGEKKVLDYINKNKIDISSESQLADIGKVSANSEEIGRILSELYTKLGKDAAITVSDGQGFDIETEIIEGMKFDKGFISPGFITDGDKEQAVVNDARILVTDQKIQNPEDIEAIRKLTMEYKVNDLVIIADDVSGLPLKTLLLNLAKFAGGLRCLAVRSPGFGQSKEYLQDIATLVGAQVISKDFSREFKDVSVEWLGGADKVVSAKDSTTIVGGKGKKKDITERIKILKNQIKDNPSAYEKEKIKERISKLSGGVAVIKVGGATETEIKEKKAKLDDAINAVRSAMEDGVIAGGGVPLLRASQILDEKIEGETILKKAIQKPFEQIIKNAGLVSDEIKKSVLENTNINYGFDVVNEKYGDMIEMGVIDSAKVTKTALQNATSLALTILTISGAIANIRETNKKSDKEEELM